MVLPQSLAPTQVHGLVLMEYLMLPREEDRTLVPSQILAPTLIRSQEQALDPMEDPMVLLVGALILVLVLPLFQALEQGLVHGLVLVGAPTLL